MDDWENVHVGTSGWHYGDWAGPFYPKDLSKKDFLAFYAEHFHTVEINNSFYQLPKEETLRGWRKAVPQEFVGCPGHETMRNEFIESAANQGKTLLGDDQISGNLFAHDVWLQPAGVAVRTAMGRQFLDGRAPRPPRRHHRCTPPSI